MGATLNQVENSSQIAAEGFDADTGMMTVQFKSGGVYQAAVDPDDYAAFAAADSKGKAFHALKGDYRFERVPDDAADSEGGEA